MAAGNERLLCLYEHLTTIVGYSFTEHRRGSTRSNLTELAIVVFLPLTAYVEMLLFSSHNLILNYQRGRWAAGPHGPSSSVQEVAQQAVLVLRVDRQLDPLVHLSRKTAGPVDRRAGPRLRRTWFQVLVVVRATRMPVRTWP